MPPRLIDVRRAAVHPQFNPQTFAMHRATADVALLQAAEPLAGKRTPAPLGTPRMPIQAGARFAVFGVGVSQRGDGKSGGAVRAAGLVTTGKPGTLQIRLVDAVTNNAREGLGACTGDSGAPAIEDQNGRGVVAGVVSWSTGPNFADGCGGITGVTPLTLYKEWIVTTARAWGAGF
jgi:hypothetical protein